MNLAKVQMLSLVTKGVTTALGIVQSVIVIRILSPAEYGLVGLVLAVGGVVGVSQHLGIVDGAIREIAVLKNRKEVGKVFWVSHLVRQIVTIPLSAGLLALAGLIAGRIYGHPEIALYLKIFAGILILQGLQDVLGATLTGIKRFRELYAVQIVTAAINVVIFGYLTWRYGMAGFFWAMVITTTIMVGLLAMIIVSVLRTALVWPNWADIKRYAWQVMRVGAYMYLARIFFIVWQRLPVLLLGGVLSAEQLGYLTVSQTFGSRLTIIGMALAEVNLSWMSSLYTQQRDKFIGVVTTNMQRVLVVMMLMTLGLLFFTPEILHYIIGAEYSPAEQIILIITFSFFLYALTDIGTSSVFVPADAPRLRVYTYGLMTIITGLIVAVLLWVNPNPYGAAWAVLAGAVASFAIMILVAQKVFKVQIVTSQLVSLLLVSALCLVWLLRHPGLYWRAAAFIGLVGWLIWEARRSHLWPGVKAMRQSLVQSADGTAGSADRALDEKIRIICFGGADYDLVTWTNRQQVASRLSKYFPVLYVEPRKWAIKYMWRHIGQPWLIVRYLKRLVAREYKPAQDRQLFIKAQWNLIPGSREIKMIARVNHWLNKGGVIRAAKAMHFYRGRQVIWLYDTEAAEYLPYFKQAKVVYDCVDNHAAQAGVDRNSQRVREEEEAILKRADLVAVTSRRLYKSKRPRNSNVQLILNAGDVALFKRAHRKTPAVMQQLKHPVIGMVGALDDYKIDFELVYQIASRMTAWSFVFIGRPIVDRRPLMLKKINQLKNVWLLGQVKREQVPAYVQAFDICFIPYRASRYNEASFPLKFWEFMAAGKPIVVTGLPELKQYRGMIGYAKSGSETINEIKRWLNKPDFKRYERQREADNNSWEKRVARLKKALMRLYA